MIENKLLIVTSAPGTRDFIYIGYATREGDMIRLERASMILRYEAVGVPGLASQPERATHLRPATGPGGEIILPLASMASMVAADPAAWESHLGVSRG